MTHIAKILVLFFVLKVALTSPICDGPNCANQDIEENKKVVDVSNKLNTSEDCSKEEAKCSSSSEESETREANDSTNEFGLRYLQPRIHTSVPYQGDQNAEDLGVGVSDYKGELYTHVHPKLLAAYNPGFRVNALPPVLSTYIHGLVPEEDIQRSAYDLDVLSPEETAYLPGLARASRMIRTSDDDWLAELQHDAMMNNIIPTMQVPFARYAAPSYVPLSGVSPSYGAASAMFPEAATGGCAQPILFSCSPRIIRGTLRPVGSYVPAPSYRQPIDHISHTSEKHSDPTKVDLAGKNVPSTAGVIKQSSMTH